MKEDNDEILKNFNFVWDKRKSNISKQKHDISFPDAIELFKQPYETTIQFNTLSEYSDRRKIITLYRDDIDKRRFWLFVFTIDDNESIRIISVHRTKGRIKA
jgi:uncharacterized DUF497 family protein